MTADDCTSIGGHPSNLSRIDLLLSPHAVHAHLSLVDLGLEIIGGLIVMAEHADATALDHGPIIVDVEVGLGHLVASRTHEVILVDLVVPGLGCRLVSVLVLSHGDALVGLVDWLGRRLVEIGVEVELGVGPLLLTGWLLLNEVSNLLQLLTRQRLLQLHPLHLLIHQLLLLPLVHLVPSTRELGI